MKTKLTIFITILASFTFVAAGCGGNKAAVRQDQGVSADGGGTANQSPSDQDTASAQPAPQPGDTTTATTGGTSTTTTTSSTTSQTVGATSTTATTSGAANGDGDHEIELQSESKPSDEAAAQGDQQQTAQPSEGETSDESASAAEAPTYAKGRAYTIDKVYTSQADLRADLRKLSAAKVSARSAIVTRKVKFTRVLVGPVGAGDIGRINAKLRRAARITDPFTIMKDGKRYIVAGSFVSAAARDQAAARIRKIGISDVTTAEVVVAQPVRTIVLGRYGSKKAFDTAVGRISKAGFSVK